MSVDERGRLQVTANEALLTLAYGHHLDQRPQAPATAPTQRQKQLVAAYEFISPA